ncbi:amidohydrolase family protein [Microbulbifer sp. CnH-101-G]|uniref:amidohydrolase family protein n=1 Tax=Microbulbifer sp. CnH-101-G TaxID=3243393 RepID=UPI00403993EA
MFKVKLFEGVSESFISRFFYGVFLIILSQKAFGETTYAVVGGKWFDGEDFKQATWFVDENGSLTKTKPQKVDYTFDASGKYVVPPYAEGHNHNLQNPWGIKNFGPLQIKSGVFYSVQMCSFGEEIKAQFNSRDTMDVLFASDCITASDGHPLGLILNGKKEVTNDELKSAQEMVLVADSKEDLDQIWEKVNANHPSFIKIILVGSEKFEERHGDQKYFGINGLNPKLVPKIVERAHQSGILVVAHVDTAHDAEVAIKAGVDVLGHLPGYRIARNEGFDIQDYVLSDTTIALAAEQGTKLIATASVPTGHKYSGDELREIQQIQRDNLTRLRNAGVSLLMGSDNFSGTVLREIRYLDSLDIAPREVLLKSLTMDTPKWMFPERDLGTFAVGAEGSFLVLEGNPLEDLGFLDKIYIGVKQGKMLVNNSN